MFNEIPNIKKFYGHIEINNNFNNNNYDNNNNNNFNRKEKFHLTIRKIEKRLQTLKKEKEENIKLFENLYKTPQKDINLLNLFSKRNFYNKLKNKKYLNNNNNKLTPFQEILKHSKEKKIYLKRKQIENNFSYKNFILKNNENKNNLLTNSNPNYFQTNSNFYNINNNIKSRNKKIFFHRKNLSTNIKNLKFMNNLKTLNSDPILKNFYLANNKINFVETKDQKNNTTRQKKKIIFNLDNQYNNISNSLKDIHYTTMRQKILINNISKKNIINKY